MGGCLNTLLLLITLQMVSVLQVSADAIQCWYTYGNTTRTFQCHPYESCCGLGCCGSFIHVYRLWYFWLCMLMILLLCSGGGYYYRKRYIHPHMLIGHPPGSAVVTMTTASSAVPSRSIHGATGGYTAAYGGGNYQSRKTPVFMGDQPPSYSQAAFASYSDPVPSTYPTTQASGAYPPPQPHGAYPVQPPSYCSVYPQQPPAYWPPPPAER